MAGAGAGEGAEGPPVAVEAAGGVGTIVLNRPAKRNALSQPVRAGIAEGMARLVDDRHVAVIVLSGSGPVFCAGADLFEPAAARAAGPSIADLYGAIMDAPKPVVCVANGAARAGGIGLMAACDVVIAPEEADFCFTEVRLGVVPAMVAVPCLERMSPRQSARYFLTGETFGAAEAVEIGLLTLAVPAGELQARARAVVDAIRLGAPSALAATKRLLYEVPRRERADGLREMAELSALFFASPDGEEGRAAFAGQRPPRWVRP